jgi:signal transduction histidine kinase
VCGGAGVDAIVDGKLDPKSRPEELAGKLVEDALVLPGGEILWATFWDGLLRTSKGGIEQLRAPEMLSDSRIRTLFRDREGSIWLGTDSGLNRLSEPRVLFYSTQEGVHQNPYGKIAMARDGRIYNADIKGNIWMGPMGEQRIWATHPAKDPDQDLLGVTRDGQVWIRDSKNVLYSIEAGVYRKSNFPEMQIAVALLETARGEIWIGTRRGSHFRGSTAGWTEVQPQMPLTRTGVNVMAEDRSGAIFVGTRSGLARFSNGVWRTWNQTNGLPSNLVTALCLSQDGIAWIGTASGIVRMDGDNLLVIDKSMGLPHEAITALTLNKNGDLWVASHAGIFRVAQDELHRLTQKKPMKTTPAVFNAKDGLKNPEGRPYGGSWVGDDGSIWMLMMRGLARVSPGPPSINPLVPETKVQEVLIDGKPAASLENLVLPSSANRLEFQFTALSLLRPERNRFRFRLVGFDKQWIDAGRQRSAVYTGLRGGSYRFEVIGANSDNIESATPAVLQFEKAKAFVETPFFILLLLVVAAGLLWVGMQLRIRNIQARHQITLAERQRIARELHDGLLQEFQGATYSLAALQLSNRDNPLGNQLDALISGLEKSLQESRGAIQNLRGRQWDGVELYPALVECAEDLCHVAQVKVRCESSFYLPEPAANVKDAFWQIAREAIRNSLKHANPTEVQLDLSSRNNQLVMQIQDDGCGFDPESVRSMARTHFGLASLEERAKSVGGELSIESEPGKGTRVQVRIAL